MIVPDSFWIASALLINVVANLISHLVIRISIRTPNAPPSPIFTPVNSALPETDHAQENNHAQIPEQQTLQHLTSETDPDPSHGSTS
jgi:hypothetical protein